jgi:hypothetical protein
MSYLSKRRWRLLAAFVISGSGAVGGADLVQAKTTKLEKSYNTNWHACWVHKKCDPGRNIARYGVQKKKGGVRSARRSELRKSLKQLKVNLYVARHPAPVIPLRTTVRQTPATVQHTQGSTYRGYSYKAPTRVPSTPTTTRRTSSGGSSNPYVNPNCESSGNSQAVDPSGTYWGKYQFDRSTWVAHGGNPGSYGSAGEAEQDQVASHVHYDAWPNC